MAQAEDFTFVVGNSDAGMRLDTYLSQRVFELTRSQIKKLVQERRILLNRLPSRPAMRLREGDVVTGAIPPPRRLEVVPQDIPLDILNEDPWIIVINKPAGMVVHPGAGIDSGTLVNALLFHCRDLSQINGVIRPGIVHRLDKNTSGVMVAAKNAAAHHHLSIQFKTRQIRKRYIALIHGEMRGCEGVIEASLGRHPKERKRTSIHTRKGRNALTQWRVIKRFKGLSLLEVIPKTGRTHQIRAHLSSQGHPIVGDPEYCRGKWIERIRDPQIRDRIGMLKRQALHSECLCLVHPRSGEFMEFNAPLPDDMAGIIQFLSQHGEGHPSEGKGGR
ncbi:MAG: RluA family pseudouridine synthase [Syntrophobacterales bacterium]|nr:MAG: RluA family pseudouridine synthase [Syntrophobacterales bacterium]